MPQIEHFTKELNLPAPIASYLRAVNTGAADAQRRTAEILAEPHVV